MSQNLGQLSYPLRKYDLYYRWSTYSIYNLHLIHSPKFILQFILLFSKSKSNLYLFKQKLGQFRILPKLWVKFLGPVNDRKYVFHFRPKPNIWPEKYLALGRIPKPKPKVQIFVKIGGILLKFNVSNDLSN